MTLYTKVYREIIITVLLREVDELIADVLCVGIRKKCQERRVQQMTSEMQTMMTSMTMTNR